MYPMQTESQNCQDELIQSFDGFNILLLIGAKMVFSMGGGGGGCVHFFLKKRFQTIVNISL